jgi:hypothetical protein
MARLAAVLALALCAGGAGAAQLSFRDIAAEVGLGDVIGTTGDSSYPDLSYVNGCGIALGDVDADGAMDLFIVQGGAPSHLFLREGAHYVDRAEAWGVAAPLRSAGALLVDLDADGLPELIVSGMHPTRVHRNLGGERFAAPQLLDDAGMGMSLAVADFDADARPDLYLARYVIWPQVVPTQGGACQWKGLPVICGPEAYRPQSDVLHRGSAAGFARSELFPQVVPGRGMGLLVLERNGDGRADLYVANDASENFLFVSQAKGFVEQAMRLGCALSADGRAEAGMGLASGDVDGNGLDDLVVTNFDGQTTSLYLADAKGWYVESSRRRGLGDTTLRRLSWGAQLADFDNDGDLDLHIVNGHLYSNADAIGDGTSWKQPDDLFVNDGRGHFTPLPAGWDGVSVESGRASALFDYDQDGRLDLLVWNLGGPLRLLHNESVAVGAALQVKLKPLRGDLSPACLAGARVRVRTAGGVQSRIFRYESGYLGGNETALHFGLGGSTEILELRVEPVAGHAASFTQRVWPGSPE